MPDVSIIIPAYNRSEMLREAIDSAANQKDVSLEIIVVDDGSTEDIPAVVTPFGDTVKYIRQENAGAPSARNRGLLASAGRYVKFLDSDDILEQDSIAAQVDAIERNNADVCYGLWKEIGTDANPDLPAPRMPHNDAIDSLLADWWAAPFSYLVRRATALKVRWDESLTSAQDFDFFFRVAVESPTFVHVPAMAGYYRFHSGTRTSRRNVGEWCGNRRRALGSAESSLRERDVLTPVRRKLLALSYFRLAQVLFRTDRDGFRELIARVYELDPSFTPPKRAHALATKWFGIERAEQLLDLRRRLLGGHRS